MELVDLEEIESAVEAGAAGIGIAVSDLQYLIRDLRDGGRSAQDLAARLTEIANDLEDLRYDLEYIDFPRRATRTAEDIAADIENAERLGRWSEWAARHVGELNDSLAGDDRQRDLIDRRIAK